MAVIKSISLNNFRIFDKMTKFELAPLTLLTGANNSGKSSLIKALLLLADNAKKNGLNELDFSGDTHHLDNFQYVKNRDSNSDLIEFGIEFSDYNLGEDINPRGNTVSVGIATNNLGEEIVTWRGWNNTQWHYNRNITLNLTFKKQEEIGILNKYSIWDNNIKLVEVIKNPSSKHEVYVNIRYFLANKDKDLIFFHSIKDEQIDVILLDKLIEQYISHFEISEQDWTDYHIKPVALFGLESILKYTDFQSATFTDIINIYSSHCLRNTHDISGYRHGISNQTLSQILPKEYYSKFSNLLSKEVMDIIEGSAFDDFKLQAILDKIIKSIKDLLSANLSLGYIECFKANSQRIYSNQSQGTNFNELLLKVSRISFDKDIQVFIIKWLKKFQIGEDFRLERLRGVATEVKIIRDGVELDLVDLGFGYTQIFPLILQIALYAQETTKVNRRDKRIGDFTILIEEPEANLHPKFQSKLIDLFLDATNTFGFHFIIETHSEYMIRRAQIVVANNTKAEKEKSEKEGDISEPKSEYIKSVSDNIRLYYFYEPKHVPKGRNQIEEIKILSDGRLDKEFGEGFFDEATNLQIELLKLKNRIN